jgi:hypothetical protein
VEEPATPLASVPATPLETPLPAIAAKPVPL